MVSPLSKDDEGFSLERREHDVGPLVEGKGDVCRPLCVISSEGLVVESLEPKDSKMVNLEVCCDEGVSGFRCPNRGPLAVESLSDPLFQKFVSFSKLVGLPDEKEIASLLRKMESIKGRSVLVVKRRPSSTPCFIRELCNLECSINYRNSNKERSPSNGRDMVCK